MTEPHIDTLGSSEITAGLLAEYDTYLELLPRLDEAAMSAPTRCEGWDVRDVAAHVVGLASDAFAGRIGRFTPQEQADLRRDLSGEDLRDELDQALLAGRPFLEALTAQGWAGPSGAPGLSMGEGILTLWFDAWVHRDDINHALGRSDPADPGLAQAGRYVRWSLARRGWVAPEGVAVEYLDPHEFVLVATGRLDPSRLGLDESVNIYRQV